MRSRVSRYRSSSVSVVSRILHVFALACLLASAGAVTADDADARIVHVVLVWLKEPGNAEHRARIVEATRGFASIRGVEEIRVGGPVPSGRPTVDDSFDVGLYMVFSSKAALDAYLVHPDHKRAQEAILRPLARRAVVYDFRDDPSQ